MVAIGSLFAVPAFAQQTPTTAAASPVVYLDQAWSQEDREWYYNFSQGSAVISYDIFLNLEVAGSEELFRSDASSERLGLIPQPANPNSNPDGLPIGISKTNVATAIKGWPAGDYAGLTCAGCHEAQLNYKGTRVRIHGGASTTINMKAIASSLGGALQAVLTDPAKFDRLASKLGANTADAKAALRKRVESEAARVLSYDTRTMATPVEWGPGRMDALSLIANRVVGVLPNIHENWTTPIAPVKPPFLWNAPQGLWTQWSGIVQDPIARNFGETAGVYLPIDLTSKTPAEGLFQSNAAIKELQEVEEQLARLAPPSWPEEVFGKIDREKAKTGKALFMENCASCHNAWPYRWTEPNKFGKRFVLVGLVPQTYVGTDPAQIQAARPFALLGQLRPFLPPELRDKEVLPPRILQVVIQRTVLEIAISKLKLTDAEKAALHGYRELPSPPPPEHVYKAAPRDGVWATPPFMHNGSVPNLYEMLIPAKERTKKFYRGAEFDPVKVGLDTSAASGAFLMDTTLLGNSNAGHSFEDAPRGNGVIGPLLTEDQRWALVEYLKSIPETPGRVTPFGGPPAGSAIP